MKKSRYTEEQIAFALRQAEGGTPVADICRQMGVSEASFYVWKKKYGKLGLTEIRELRQLREEVKAMRAAQGTKPADASGWGERIDQLEIKAKDAVVLGDIGGGFRLPGSETSIRLYGYAEAHVIHDAGRSGPSDNFTDLMAQPVGSEIARPGKEYLGLKGKTKLTAQTSRFGFETSTPTSAGTFNTKVEADFYSYGSGNRNRLRLRHAYGEYAGWLVGQTWSTFMDLDDLPETVDFNGPIGAPFSRRTMIRYTYGMPQEGVKLTFALEDPQDQFGGGSANERMPQLGWRLLADALANIQVCLLDESGAATPVGRESTQQLFESLQHALPRERYQEIMAYSAQVVMAWQQARRQAH